MALLVLTLDSAAAGGGAALVRGKDVMAWRPLAGTADSAAALAPLVASLLSGAGDPRPDLIAVCTGPGSFTGLRAGLALAAGLGAGWGIPALGVGLAQAWACQLRPVLHGRALWVTVHARTGRFYLAEAGRLIATAADALPAAPKAVVLAGDAARDVATALQDRGTICAVIGGARPQAWAFAAAAVQGGTRDLAPLYGEAALDGRSRGSAPGLLPLLPPTGPALASAVHAAAFPPGEAWNTAAFESLISVPGTAGWLDPRGGVVLYRTLFEESELLTLGVVPSARRRGVAAALLGHWIGAMRGDGCRRLLLEVSARNQAARALYEQAGFQVYATRQGYYADGAAALLLELALTGAA